MLRDLEQRARAERLESKAHHFDRSGRPQHELARHLAREDQIVLPLRTSFVRNAVEPVAQMKDQLRPPVRQHRLQGTAEHGRVSLERPHPFNERRQRRQRPMFLVMHVRTKMAQAVAFVQARGIGLALD